MNDYTLAIYRITKNFRETPRSSISQRSFAKEGLACATDKSNANFREKLSRHSKIREIREGFLSRKFLVIRYARALVS